MSRFAADDPTHRRIVAQTFSVVHVLISSKAAKHPLPQQTDQRMAAVLARARIGKHLARYRGQPECVVEFAVRQQSRIGRDHGAAKLEHQAAVKIEPDGIRFRFTRWVRHRRLPPSRISCCALYLNRGDRRGNQRVIQGMQVKGSGSLIRQTADPRSDDVRPSKIRPIGLAMLRRLPACWRLLRRLGR